MQRFQVELSGLVNLLSRHLYSGPQVFVRELMQNGVDAITARRAFAPGCPARITFTVRDELLEVRDTGVGLDEAEAEELLATIGRSSKRDAELGGGREEFLGQFGVGMLAAFMVATRIEVFSHSAKQADAATVHWVGQDDGTFTVSRLPAGHPDALDEPGSLVRLRARADMRSWLEPETVRNLAEEYGGLLDIPITVADHSTTSVDSGPVRVNEPTLPWLNEYPSATARRQALHQYCETTFGFTPIGMIDFSVPVSGVSGVAFVLPQAVASGAHGHRVYLKRMLVSAHSPELLPDWAFFVRAVADTGLSPTASREALHEDELLEATREAIGGQLKAWIRRNLRSGLPAATQFIRTHSLALRSLALEDDEMLELVSEVLPYETSDGLMPLAAAVRGGELRYAATTETFRTIAPIARAQGIVLVNAGYVYDGDIMHRLARHGWVVNALGPNDLVQELSEPADERKAVVAGALARARQVLDADDCDVVLREFEPAHTPALMLRNREQEFQRELREEQTLQDDAWGSLLGAFTTNDSTPTRTLVLNDATPVVRQLLDADGIVFDAGVRSLYLSALMLAGEGLRSSEIETLNTSLSTLLGASLGGTH